MKKIFWIVKKEFKSLYKILLLITVIITLFLSAFSAVVNLRIDFMKNFKQTLSNELNELFFDVDKVSVDSLNKYLSEDCMLIAMINGVTDSATIVGKDGKTFETEQITHDDKIIIINNYPGRILYNYNAYKRNIEDKFNQSLIDGAFISNVGEIMLSSFIADKIDCSVGDIVKIKDFQFRVIGIYDYEVLESTPYYYISIPNDVVLNVITLQMPESYDTYKLFNKLKGKGYEVSCVYSSYFDNMLSLRVFLDILAVLIFVAISIVIYCFISIIMMWRKGYICQLKLLGATELEIFTAYVFLILMLLIVATFVATFVGYFINIYIINLWVKLFEVKIVASVNIYIPFAVFFGFSIFSAMIYLFINRKSKNKIIAQAIKEG